MMGSKSELGVGSRTMALCSAQAQNDATAHRGNARVGAGAHLNTGSSVDMRRRGVLRMASVASALQAALRARRRRRNSLAAAIAVRRVRPGGEEGRVVIFDRQVEPGAALRAGWNDAAWGQPRREVHPAVAPLYERGYAGGLVFRQKQQHNTSAPDVLGPALRIVPAAQA
jgi:hypothetical protein